MPLLLDDIDLQTAQTSKTTIDPKFFSSKLTGNGNSKVGLLSSEFKPVLATTNSTYISEASRHQLKKSSTTQNGITVTTIPFAPVPRHIVNDVTGSTVVIPDDDLRFEIKTNQPGVSFSLALNAEQAIFIEDTNGGSAKSKTFIALYRYELFWADQGHTLTAGQRASLKLHRQPANTHVMLSWGVDPVSDLTKFVDDVLSTTTLTWTNMDQLSDWLLNEVSVYDRITAQAQIWSSTAMADEVGAIIDAAVTNSTVDKLDKVASLLRYMENYVVPLEAYVAIHQKIESSFAAEHVAELAKQNSNLLMSHTLSELEKVKSQLVVPVQPAALPLELSKLSPQQRAAAMTHEPLAMTQAGAGTGKSTQIIMRIKYLEACNVPSADITVLSFTNAAADNITERNPDVGSMTIARMIHDIYMLNHPTHELSSIDTIINSIDIFEPHSSLAMNFRNKLMQVDKNDRGAMTALNTFIENNYDEVIALLDKIGQTSLELEIIICYQRIEHMIEPAHVKCQYLIIDEVQDNSIFEFIYVLKYVTKHKLSLFIVGDASQTLYEFRSANPRALNTLEGSGVFSTFKLTTNYRSNQEILDFANATLGGLETNQIARIQLQANSLDVPTAKSFQEKVTVDHHLVGRLSQFVSEDLGHYLRATVGPNYIDACLARGQQVAFLAYSRREVQAIQDTLELMYPSRSIASLISEKVFATDIFSKFIKNHWNTVLVVQPANAAFTVAQSIKDNFNNLASRKATKKTEQAVQKMISNWWLENSATIQGWVQLCHQGSMTHATFFEQLRDNLLSFEIRHNAVRQSLMAQRNRERKAKNMETKADLVVSTIHGAKGMEFDNVVVLYKDSHPMSQDTARMFYVAFTRAMKSEYILAYGTRKTPPVVSNYEQIVNLLTERDEKAAQARADVDPDLLEEDASEADAERSTAVPATI